MFKKFKPKKLATIFLASLYAIFTSISVIPVHAATYIATIDNTGYKSYRNFKTHDRFSDIWYEPGLYDIAEFQIDGKRAYCIEPAVVISNNPIYAHEKIEGRSKFKEIGFTDSEIDRMAYISSLGYGFKGDNSKAMLAATQLMIWQVSLPDGYSQIPSEVQQKINVINERLNTIYNDVSFAGTTVELEGYGEQYAVTLNDSTGTFSNYLNNSIPNGIHVERNGDSLKVWADKSAAESGNLVFDAFYLRNEATNTEIAYYQPLNQTLAVFGKKDPKAMRVSYKILVQPETAEVSSSKKGTATVDTNLNMHKTDKDSKKGIKGIEFEFFRDDVSLGKAKTDSNGNVAMPSHIEKTFISDTFKETYVTNWNDLSERMQQECLSKGWFSSQGEAQASADKKAQDQLNGLIEAYQNEKHVYKAVETNSGYYYYLDPDTTVSVEYAGSGDVNMEKDNQRYTLSIDLQKYDDDITPVDSGLTEEEFEDFLQSQGPRSKAIDSKASNKTQGDATLKGAVFGLYAAVNIYNPENQSEILYHAGDKVMEITTDENGYADTSAYVDKNGKAGLYIGSQSDDRCWYYFKEIRSPEGYELNELFQAYMRYGGMPGIADVGLEQERVLTLLDGIYSTVIVRDILERETLKSQRKITDSVLLLADNIGSNISISKIGNVLMDEGLLEKERKTKPSHHTVQAYVNALLEAYFFYEIKRFDIKGKEYLRTLGKFYIVDIGLRNYLLGYRNRDTGHVLENIVYFELLKRGYDIAVGKINQLEIDFIATKADEKLYVQVTESMISESVRKRELTPLEKVNDNYEKIILSLDNETMSYNGIKLYNIMDWLIE